MTNFNITDVINFVKQQQPGTRVYLGADSRRYIKEDTWWATYTVAIVIHINGNRGCKIFGDVSNERDYDKNAHRPSMRLMNEVYKVSEMYSTLNDALPDTPIEVHLDISADPVNGSNCIIQQAIGYIRGTCNVIPMVKPHAFAASCAADRYTNLRKQA